MSPEYAGRIAEELIQRGVSLPPEPAGLVLRDQVVLTPGADGNYTDGRGRDAYLVGPGTPLEGPWWCPRCGEVRIAGFFVLPEGEADPWFICTRCVQVVR